jgi:heme/copper-type cytochrome/quinol oxidase subunit 1
MLLRYKAHLKATGIILSSIGLLYLNYKIWDYLDVVYFRNITILHGMILGFLMTAAVITGLVIFAIAYSGLVDGIEDEDQKRKSNG